MNALLHLAFPNIIYLYDVAYMKHFVFLFLEFCPGGSVLDMMTRSGCLHDAALKRMSSGILRGLVDMHSKRFAHLDMKLATVLIDRFGRQKLADFGLSGHLAPEHAETRQRAGTLCYIAPEMLISHSAPYDPFKADIWAFGVTCYVMAFGRPPWEALKDEIMNTELSFPPETDTTFAEAVRNMLTLDPEERPTASQCLEIPFFVRHGTAGDAALGASRRLTQLPKAISTASSAVNLSFTIGRHLRRPACPKLLKPLV
jgi:polo-like kinase 1